MGILPKTLVNRLRPRSEDPETSTLWTTPWAWRDEDGAYVGWNGDVWLYRSFPITPIDSNWEDPGVRLAVGSDLERALVELGETSKESATGFRTLNTNREVHLISITWDAEARPPTGTPPKLAEYLNSSFGFLVPTKALLIGVKLRISGAQTAASVTEGIAQLMTKGLGEDVPDISRYDSDRQLISNILARAGARIPKMAQLRQLESWYNLGRGTDALIVEDRDHLRIDDIDRIEMASVARFRQMVNYAPFYQWMAEAEAQSEGARVISVRAELEPPTVARKRLRQSQRRIKSMIEEEEATGDIDRPEFSDTLQLASAVEEHFINSTEPLMTNTSIVIARRATGADETYIDYLRNYRGIEVRPLAMRQLPGLDETLPCSSKRLNPFLQDVSVGMIAYAGLHGFSTLGDSKGAYIGLTHPNLSLCYLDFLAAPAANLPPSTAIFGDPGSGKSYLCQMIALQAALSGLPVIFINPKGYDSLAPLANLVNGNVVQVSRLETAGGFFDPFRYARDPEMAAEIATTHILSVLTGFDESKELKLAHGLKNGALHGARCVREALSYVEDQEIVDRVMQQTTTSSTFALGIGLEPQERIDVDRNLTLIEFDRKLNLPDPTKEAAQHTRDERIALAAIRLVTRASLEILAGLGGGVMIVDEAWTFLSHPAGQAALQQLGREGRSLNVLPVFATQRVADLLGHDMEGYLSRVFVMKLSDEREASAALKLCGLEATSERLAWLRQAGPQQGDDETPERWAMALHRDLKDRHAAVLVGPVPNYARVAFTTNPEERKKIREALGEVEPGTP